MRTPPLPDLTCSVSVCYGPVVHCMPTEIDMNLFSLSGLQIENDPGRVCPSSPAERSPFPGGTVGMKALNKNICCHSASGPLLKDKKRI